MIKMAKFGFFRSYYSVKMHLIFLKLIFLQEYWISRKKFTVDFFEKLVKIGPIFVSSALLQFKKHQNFL